MDSILFRPVSSVGRWFVDVSLRVNLSLVYITDSIVRSSKESRRTGIVQFLPGTTL